MDSITPIFVLPEDSSLGLRDQICEMVSSAITNQALSPEKRLPSCREMAEQLGVSRNTVFSAYNRLMDLGLLIAKNRSGYFVNPIAHEQDLHGHRADLSDIPAPVKFKPLGLVPVDNPLNWKSYTYPFIYNQIDPDLFPVDSWRECTRLALRRTKMPAWRDDSVESDSPQLLQQLRQRLLSTRGIYIDKDEVLITLGAQNALYIIGASFAHRKKPIAIEDPGFSYGRNAFQLAGNKVVGVPVDNQGLIVSRIPDNCQLVFTTPSHQFPTMVTMTNQRRKKLLEAAVAKDFLIIEDDYEAEMNFFNNRSQSLRSLDKNGRVIYVGSLSKTLSPGIRLGFMVAHRDIIRQARIVRGVMMRHAPTIVQEVVALFFQLGYYDSHLRNIERRYKRRWHVMNDAINKHLGMLEQAPTRGGTCFWLTGPKGFNSTELGERLRERGVLIDIGERFSLKKDQRSFRLGFAFVPLKKLEEGIRIISEEVKRQI
ncbi:MAG: PLP-dependent aminotransferase family protein [Gammaproteobacteria bacterium]|nr:PLP-dependent aminotransferase family protein [Gammaproteobacteria bacterium]MYG66015.1 PLP-dependent aminotransferase family protein [Gammaproteobacteria bacterium]